MKAYSFEHKVEKIKKIRFSVAVTDTITNIFTSKCYNHNYHKTYVFFSTALFGGFGGSVVVVVLGFCLVVLFCLWLVGFCFCLKEAAKS